MRKSILMMAAIAALTFVSCEEKPYIESPGNNVQVPDSMPVTVDPEPTPDPEGMVIPEDAITVNEAVNIAKKLHGDEVTDKEYLIKGWVNRFDEKERAKADFEDKFKQYGNDYVHLSARNDGQGKKEFYCYRILGPKGSKYPDHDALKIGDFIVVKCKLTKYGDVIENSGACWTVASNNEHFNEVFADALIPEDTIHATCAEAKAAALAMASGATSKDIYVVEGYVQSAGYDATISKGQQKWFWIDDQPTGNKVLEAYWCNVPDGKTAVPVGAKVRLTGNLMNYNGNIAEIKNGDIEILESPAQ